MMTTRRPRCCMRVDARKNNLPRLLHAGFVVVVVVGDVGCYGGGGGCRRLGGDDSTMMMMMAATAVAAAVTSPAASDCGHDGSNGLRQMLYNRNPIENLNVCASGDVEQ